MNLSPFIGLEAKTGGGIDPEGNQQCLTRQVPQGRPLQAPQADGCCEAEIHQMSPERQV